MGISQTNFAGGRYVLVRQLALGGMAEVWLARQTGPQGFEKWVVVKRILPHLATDPQFVQMFLDEARTVAGLRHHNLVSVTDVGSDDGAWFIVMEYLRGQDLGQLVRRCQRRGVQLPLGFALQVVLEAAQGLDCAHRKVDAQGVPQRIVHRDVSPQNLFVTYDGVTKVLDFGIAVASGRATNTEAGIVKGKFGYMSPEQVDGAELDPRSDLFTLGAVLFELVTGQKLFARASEADTLRAVLECKVPRPSSLRMGVPPQLDALILKALQRDPRARFGSCGEFAQALGELIDAHQLGRSAGSLGAWLRDLFPEHARPPEDPVVPDAADAAEHTRNERTPTREAEAITQPARPRELLGVPSPA